MDSFAGPGALLVALALPACTPAGSSPTPPASASASAATSASTSASTAPSATPGAPFTCFSWVHLAAFSTDCYRTAAACEEERESMKRGARDPAPCEPRTSASCTVLQPDGAAQERCFGDAGACGRYRAMVTSRGLATGPCEGR